jgi:hypothetical protein
MKRTTRLIYILLLITSTAFSQTADFKFEAKPDSIIEKRQRGYIYVTSDTKSVLYDRIIPRLDRDAITLQTQYINDIRKKYKQEVKQFPVKSFPRKWNSVYLYKNKYYLYGPSDWMDNRGFYVSDSVVYITESDVSDVYVIKNFEKDGPDNGHFKVINYTGETLHIQIRVVEKSLGIYEWTMQGGVDDPRKFLMQNSDLSKKLKIIVCDCGDEKCVMEFKFE